MSYDLDSSFAVDQRGCWTLPLAEGQSVAEYRFGTFPKTQFKKSGESEKGFWEEEELDWTQCLQGSWSQLRFEKLVGRGTWSIKTRGHEEVMKVERENEWNYLRALTVDGLYD